MEAWHEPVFVFTLVVLSPRLSYTYSITNDNNSSLDYGRQSFDHVYRPSRGRAHALEPD